MNGSAATFGQSGQYNVYGFREKNRVAWRSAPFVAAQMTGVFEKVEGDGDEPAPRDTGWQALWTASGGWSIYTCLSSSRTSSTPTRMG